MENALASELYGRFFSLSSTFKAVLRNFLLNVSNLIRQDAIALRAVHIAVKRRQIVKPYDLQASGQTRRPITRHDSHCPRDANGWTCIRLK